MAEALGVSPASWPLFGLVWESGEVLARIMAEYDVANLRILEVGCGVGLSSLVLNWRHADITATDYHPRAQEYLNWNTQLNDGQPIPFIRTGWADDPEVESIGEFDLIIGGDVLYEPDHPELLAHFIAERAKPRADVILVDPGRGWLPTFARALDKSGFQKVDMPVDLPTAKSLEFKGQIRRFTRKPN